MYLRHTTVHENGKERVYWRIVRSVRHGRRVRQETVAMLGELDARGRASARALADSITGRRTRPSLFEPPEWGEDERVAVRLNAVRIEHSHQFGAY